MYDKIVHWSSIPSPPYKLSTIQLFTFELNIGTSTYHVFYLSYFMVYKMYKLSLTCLIILFFTINLVNYLMKLYKCLRDKYLF